jgi:type III pantothenate kinase
MLLAIDIGNTITTFGVFEDEKLVVTWRLATDNHRTVDEYAVVLTSLLRLHGLDTPNITAAAICCVVPPLLPTYEELLERYYHITPLVVETGIKTGVRIRLENPKEVGADRIVNVAAAHHLYGSPAIIVDLGTATTFDVISKEGDYLGGAIVPGLGTAADALYGRAAKLPRVEITPPKHAIGTNTVSAMQSGLVFGYVALTEGLVARLQKELGEKARVIATGGWAELIGRETSVFDTINMDLTLIGLRIIYYMNKKT